MTRLGFRICIACALAMGFVVIVGADLAEASEPPNETIRASIQRHSAATTKPYEEPDAAAELYWRKRQGPGPGFDAQAAYRTAMAQYEPDAPILVTARR